MYLPEYLQKGYGLTSQEGILHKAPRIQTTYGSTGYIIEFSQTVGKVKNKIDNENGIWEKVNINGKEGWYQETDDIKRIDWSKGEYIYSLVL